MMKTQSAIFLLRTFPNGATAMLLYQYLLSEAGKKRIDTDREAARRWVEARLGNRLEKGKRGRRVIVRTPFQWTPRDWDCWQRGFKALARLDGEAHRHQSFSAEALGFANAALMKTIVVVCARSHKDIEEGRGIRFGFSTDEPPDGGTSPRVLLADHNVNTIWQAAFLSFFFPSAIAPERFCLECGESLPVTKKTGKPSRARLCRRCRFQKWKRENPEKVRENWKLAKRRDRKPG
jgi:hypothetical protein